MCRTKISLALAASMMLILMLAVPVISANANFPTETTRINEVHLNDENAEIIAKFTFNLETKTVDVGTLLAHATVRVRISKEYAATVNEAKNNTRIYLSIISPDGIIILENALGTPTYVTTMATYYLVPYQHDIISHTLQKGIYTITVVYEILIDGVWTHADDATYFLSVVYSLTPAEGWLPIMLSFAVIVGMAFIGFNLSKGRDDPAAGPFMLFVGVILTWSIGWLPSWILLIGLAILALFSARLFIKIYERGA